MPNIVSGTLDACWKAVEIWEPLRHSFERKFKSNDELQQLALAGVAPGDIGVKSAIVLKQQSFNIVPAKTMSLSWPIALKVEIYAPADRYRQTIDLLEEVVRSWFKAKEGTNSGTVLEMATCGPPKQIIAFSVEWINIPQGANSTSVLQVCYGSAVVVFQGEFQV